MHKWFPEKKGLISGISIGAYGVGSLEKLNVKEGFLFHGAPTFVISPNASNATLASMSMELMAEAQGLGIYIRY